VTTLRTSPHRNIGCRPLCTRKLDRRCALRADGAPGSARSHFRRSERLCGQGAGSNRRPYAYQEWGSSQVRTRTSKTRAIRVRRNRDRALARISLGRGIECDQGLEQFHAVSRTVTVAETRSMSPGLRAMISPRRMPHHAPSRTAARYRGVIASMSATTWAMEATRAFLSPVGARTGDVARIHPDCPIPNRAVHDRTEKPVGLLNRGAPAAAVQHSGVPFADHRRRDPDEGNPSSAVM
jgi:hypothetical protein